MTSLFLQPLSGEIHVSSQRNVSSSCKSHRMANTSYRLTRSRVRKLESIGTDGAPDIEDIVPETSHRTGRKRKYGEAQNPTLQLLAERSTQAKPSKAQAKEGNHKPSRNRDPTIQVQRHPVKQETQPDGKIVTYAPANWEEMYALTAAMRKLNPAPVDTMGCESLAEAGLSDRDQRFQTLVALMLSSQTKDTVTALTIRRLQTELPRPGLTLERILEVEPAKLNEMIWAVGFHNNKTKFIKRTAEILSEKFNGDIPDTIEGMTSLPGVGPKMAYLCMSSAWGRDEGIGVDVHVHRITNLWGWHKTKNPEETRAVLESWLPKDKWHDINHLLVGFGQTICAPIGRRCHECTLSEKNLCPSAVVGRKINMHNARRKKDSRKSIMKLEEDALTIDGSQVKSEAIAERHSPDRD